MRAIRPNSRRGSWGSDETGWSAAGHSTHTGVSSAGPGLLGFGGVGGMGVGGHRRRGPGSVATAWSWRTGGTNPAEGYLDGTEIGPNDEDEEEEVEEEGDEEVSVKVDSEAVDNDTHRGDVTPTEDAFDLPEPSTDTAAVGPHNIPLPNSPPRALHTALPPSTTAA